MKFIMSFLALQILVGLATKTETRIWPEYNMMRRTPRGKPTAVSIEVNSQGRLKREPLFSLLLGKRIGNQGNTSMKVREESALEQSSQSMTNPDVQHHPQILGGLQQRGVNKNTVSINESALITKVTANTATAATRPRWPVKLHGSGVDIAEIFVSEDNSGVFKTHDAEDLAATLLKQEGLIRRSGACDLCGPTAEHGIDCCLQWLQNGMYLSDVAQLHPDNQTDLRVFLAAEQGFDPSLIRFVRGVKLGHPVYVQLLEKLRHIGVYAISQMSGVDPSELVSSMGYTDGDSVRSMLIAKIAAQADVLVARNQSKGNTHQDAAKLIHKYGLLRGVLISSVVESTNLQEGLQFTPSAAMSTEDAIVKAVLLAPDEKTAQLSMQSLSSTKIGKASYMMETFGMSSVKSKSFGISGNLGIGSSVSISGSYSSSSNESTTKSQGKSASTDLNSFTKEFTKSLYFVEPRQLVVVDPALLQPTPALKRAFRDVKKSLESNTSVLYSVNHLFRDFGTHTCTKALLGGWWKLTAQESTATAQLAMEMAKEASYALEQTVGNSFSFSASVNVSSVQAGLSIGSTNNRADSQSQEAKSGTKRASNHSDIISEISQEWKGGISGLEANIWRKSLDDSQTWKVIDRYIDSCRGIWLWSDDTEVSKMLCQGWHQGVIREIQKELGRRVEVPTGWGDCDRTTLTNETTLIKKECMNLPGHHLQDGRCVMNKCFCGDRATPGETGKNCPKDGTMKCRPYQRATCSTLACPPKFWQNAKTKNELCATSTCSAKSDVTACCQRIEITNAWSVNIKHCDPQQKSSSCQDQLQISFQLQNGVKGSSVPSAPPKHGQWEVYDFSSPSQSAMSRICLIYQPKCQADKWCVDQVTVHNGHVPKGAASKIAWIPWSEEFGPGRKGSCKNLSGFI